MHTLRYTNCSANNIFSKLLETYNQTPAYIFTLSHKSIVLCKAKSTIIYSNNEVKRNEKKFELHYAKFVLKILPDDDLGGIIIVVFMTTKREM